MKIFSKAFTLSETLIVLCVLGVIVALTAVSTLNMDSINEKKLASVSQGFYSNVENAYQQILYQHTTNGSILGLNDKNGDGEVDSIDLKDYFSKYMDGEDTPCSNLKLEESIVSGYLTDASCAILAPNVIAGFFLDTSCSLEVETKEYLTENHNSKTVENACGRIIYGTKDSKGKFTYDIFTIALGKSRVR